VATLGKTEDQSIQETYQELCRGDQDMARARAERMVSLHPELAEGWVILALLSAPRASVKYMKRAVQEDSRSQRARAGLRWAINRLRENPSSAYVNLAPPVRDVSAIARPKERSKILNRHVFLLTGLIVVAGSVVLGVLWNTPEERRPNLQKISNAISAALPAGISQSIIIPTILPTISGSGGNLIPSSQAPDQLSGIVAPGGSKSITVRLMRQRLYAYQDNALAFSFVVSTGRNGNTAPGSYQILDKTQNAYSELWGFFMPYWMGLYYTDSNNENGFHGLPSFKDGTTLWGDALGTPITYGCIVLGPDDARALFEWADIGTPVIVTD
jgi:hypothetical protein